MGLTATLLPLAIALMAGPAPTSESPDAKSSVAASAADAPAEEVPAEDEDSWSFSASVYGYEAKEDTDYFALTLMADRNWLHLEARYNYEDLDTYSLFAGYNLSVGERVTFDFTPMVGLVTGDFDAMAPGYEITLGYQWLELYTEGEFVFDMKDSENDYFYSWSELTVSPTDWFFAGIAAQRTKVREDASDVEWGPMLGFAHKNIEWAIYAFEPGTDVQTLATSFTVHF